MAMGADFEIQDAEERARHHDVVPTVIYWYCHTDTVLSTIVCIVYSFVCIQAPTWCHDQKVTNDYSNLTN